MHIGISIMSSENLEKLKSFTERVEAVLDQFSQEKLMMADKGGEGWTPIQLVHHICDAHTQTYFRIKWLVTEEFSVLKPFDQDRWAEPIAEYTPNTGNGVDQRHRYSLFNQWGMRWLQKLAWCSRVYEN